MTLEEMALGEAHLQLLGILLRERYDYDLEKTVIKYFTEEHYDRFEQFWRVKKDIGNDRKARMYYDAYIKRGAK